MYLNIYIYKRRQIFKLIWCHSVQLGYKCSCHFSSIRRHYFLNWNSEIYVYDSFLFSFLVSLWENTHTHIHTHKVIMICIIKPLCCVNNIPWTTITPLQKYKLFNFMDERVNNITLFWLYDNNNNISVHSMLSANLWL